MSALSLILIAAFGSARADVVTFTNGNKMSGVVLSRQGETIELQVDEEGLVELSSTTVARIDTRTAKENAALMASWRARNAKAVDAEKKDRAFAQEQRVKGFVLYEGEWMKPVEAEKRLAAKKLQAETQEQRAQTYVPAETAPDLSPKTTVSQIYSYFLIGPAAERPVRRPQGRVFIFKDGHAVEKRGRVIDLSGSN